MSRKSDGGVLMSRVYILPLDITETRVMRGDTREGAHVLTKPRPFSCAKKILLLRDRVLSPSTLRDRSASWSLPKIRLRVAPWTHIQNRTDSTRSYRHNSSYLDFTCKLLCAYLRIFRNSEGVRFSLMGVLGSHRHPHFAQFFVKNAVL